VPETKEGKTFCLKGQCHQFRKFATGINITSETGGKFAAGVVDTGGAP
jgi:hypothetical protein